MENNDFDFSTFIEHDYNNIFQNDLSDYEYNELMAQLAGVSMCAWENGYNSIDDNGADFGDDVTDNSEF